MQLRQEQVDFLLAAWEAQCLRGDSGLYCQVITADGTAVEGLPLFQLQILQLEVLRAGADQEDLQAEVHVQVLAEAAGAAEGPEGSPPSSPPPA